MLRPVHRELLSLAAVVVVDTPTATALERLVGSRGMERGDAEARIASQVDRVWGALASYRSVPEDDPTGGRAPAG